MTAPAQHGQREAEQRKAKEKMDPLPNRAAGHIAQRPQHEQDASHRPEHDPDPFEWSGDRADVTGAPPGALGWAGKIDGTGP
jgi:hypothetical protein